MMVCALAGCASVINKKKAQAVSNVLNGKRENLCGESAPGGIDGAFCIEKDISKWDPDDRECGRCKAEGEP